MRLGVLFSGGKDSTLALHRASKAHEIACLITVVSENDASFMFHTPNIDITKLQAECLGIPLVRVKTKGEKEVELNDLRQAIEEAREKHGIEGVVTGAVRSTYQAVRIQKICAQLKLWCFNPLWLMDQVELLNEVVDSKIVAVIGGVFAEGLDSFLGRQIDGKCVTDLALLAKKSGINAAGEGGEIETTVLDAPLFKKKIKITKSAEKREAHTGLFQILEAKVIAK